MEESIELAIENLRSSSEAVSAAIISLREREKSHDDIFEGCWETLAQAEVQLALVDSEIARARGNILLARWELVKKSK